MKRKPSAVLAAVAIWWMPAWTHPQHHQPVRNKPHKFVSHYCQTTASPYIGGPNIDVCCQWHSYYAHVPDGAGYWDCTFNPTATAARRS